jgi:hypothetical protein
MIMAKSPRERREALIRIMSRECGLSRWWSFKGVAFYVDENNILA